LAKLSGLLEPLRQFMKENPVWGSCAGAILMSRGVENAKRGGQELLGGVSVITVRNGYGSQLESFEAQLDVKHLRDPGCSFPGVFIRAPVVFSLCPAPADPPIEIISQIPEGLLPPDLREHATIRAIVAFRQGNHLFTSFHPELTKDDRFHEYFVRECVLPNLN